jgi:hypothetical protein
VAAIDPGTTKLFYHDVRSGVSTWIPPADFQPPLPLGPPPGVRPTASQHQQLYEQQRQQQLYPTAPRGGAAGAVARSGSGAVPTAVTRGVGAVVNSAAVSDVVAGAAVDDVAVGVDSDSSGTEDLEDMGFPTAAEIQAAAGKQVSVPPSGGVVGVASAPAGSLSRSGTLAGGIGSGSGSANSGAVAPMGRLVPTPSAGEGDPSGGIARPSPATLLAADSTKSLLAGLAEYREEALKEEIQRRKEHVALLKKKVEVCVCACARARCLGNVVAAIAFVVSCVLSLRVRV